MERTVDLKKKWETGVENEEKFERFDGRPDEEKLVIGAQPIQISWSGLLRNYSPNLKAISIFSGLLFLVGVFFIFFQKNIFAAAFFMAAAGFLLISAKKKAPETDFVVGPLSIKVGSNEHTFKEIKSFWVEYNPEGVKELSLQLKKWYMPYLKIPIYHQNPVQIRAILLKFIPEVEHEDTILNVLERVLGL